MKLVDLVNSLKDRLVPYDLLGGINTKIDAFLEFHEIGLIAGEHAEVVNFLTFLGVEVFTSAPNLHIIKLRHEITEPVIEELDK